VQVFEIANMPIHDWSRVEAGIFHALHVRWVGEIQGALNAGLLPEGYYALAEQHAGHSIADVLTLHAPPASHEPIPSLPTRGGTAVAEAPPKVRRHQSIEPAGLVWRRTLAIRHISGHRLVAIVEILSPANKDRQKYVEDFAWKAVDAIRTGIHVLLVDLFPPGSFDPHGMHDVICELMEDEHEPYDLPAEEPFTLASYVADRPVEIYLEHLAPGASLPDMPLFIDPERYVATPLESTYAAAYRGMPAFWRDVLEGHSGVTE
jgi:hypothetical protein